MNDPMERSETVEAGNHSERPERLVHHLSASSRPSRDPSPPEADRNRRQDSYEGAALARARGRVPGVSPWLFVLTTALNTMVAAVLAVIIALGVVRRERRDAPPREAVASASAYPGPAVAARSERTTPNPALQQINLRPIGSPDQPLRLEAQRATPLPLQIEPEEAASEPFILALSGAPRGLVLSGATRIGSDTWFLPPDSADRLEIALPDWLTSVFEINVALRRTNGLVAAQTKAWITAPPPANRLPASPTIDDATAKEFLAKAERLLQKGDIVGARTVYQRAAEQGDGSAALALGATYDPNRLWSLGALGLVGNRERARQWYQRASDLGHPEAKARITALGFP